MRSSDYTTKIVQTGHIVNYYWPKYQGKNVGKINVKHEHDFLESMRKCQIEMIKFYFHTMDRETTVRAIRTLKLLGANKPEIKSGIC